MQPIGTTAHSVSCSTHARDCAPPFGATHTCMSKLPRQHQSHDNGCLTTLQPHARSRRCVILGPTSDDASAVAAPCLHLRYSLSAGIILEFIRKQGATGAMTDEIVSRCMVREREVQSQICCHCYCYYCYYYYYYYYYYDHYY